MSATMTLDVPILGPSYDKNRPETKDAWLAFRRPGLTATMIRDWGIGSRKRAILTEKVTGEFEDLSRVAEVNHGNTREPIIQQWVQERFGIAPCDAVFAHPHNPRHLASPDGISVDPFVGALVVGPEAVVLEIKTSVHDLTPGVIDAARVLTTIAQGSYFAKANYYTQMQWQMYVMNAARTLFVWERRSETADPETGLFPPVGPPEWCWVPRDQALIDVLVERVAPAALAEIDAALLANTLGELPPVSDLPTEDAVLVAEYFQALDAEKIATAAKQKAWDALKDRYTGDDKPDVSIDAGFARVTVSTSRKQVARFNEALAREKAPKAMAEHDKLVKRYTENVETVNQTLTVTRPK